MLFLMQLLVGQKRNERGKDESGWESSVGNLSRSRGTLSLDSIGAAILGTDSRNMVVVEEVGGAQALRRAALP